MWLIYALLSAVFAAATSLQTEVSFDFHIYEKI